MLVLKLFRRSRLWPRFSWLGLVTLCFLVACTPTGAPADLLQTTGDDLSQPSPSNAETEAVRPALVFTDGLGEDIAFEAPPERIVSLAPSNTEILFAVGAADQVVGRDEYSDYPVEALEIPSIGDTYSQLNTEAIVALEPDLILVAEITPLEQIETMKSLGLKVFQVPNPQSFEGLYRILETVGTLTGHESTTLTLIADLQRRVAAVEAAVEQAEIVRVYYEVDGTDPSAPWTTGSGTFQQVLIEMVKGENIADDLEGWGAVNLEQIVVRDPEVILFGEGPWVPTTIESIKTRAGWGAITAVVNEKVYAVDTHWIDRPGPRLVDALERFATVIQPEAFE